MRFVDLPRKVQVIAANCLADKINVSSGLTMQNQNGPAKEQARQVREAFIELYFPSESSSVQNDNDPSTL